MMQQCVDVLTSVFLAYLIVSESIGHVTVLFCGLNVLN